MKNSKIAKMVTDRIIKLIEESDELVWQKSWAGSGIAACNYTTKKSYRGFNRFVTNAFFADPYFMTFNQVKKAGGTIKKGAKSVPIVYFNWVYFDEDGNKVKNREDADKKIPFMRYSNVFNASDIEGIDFVYPEVETLNEDERVERCEKIVSRNVEVNGLKLKSGERKAYYRPSTDSVHMPDFELFKNAESYYSVLFHEMSHWTGHSKRLDRELDTAPSPFGSKDYSFEELVAEMSAAFICSFAQIDNEQLNHNHAAYLDSWLKALRAKPDMLIRASNKAEKAFEYITTA